MGKGLLGMATVRGRDNVSEALKLRRQRLEALAVVEHRDKPNKAWEYLEELDNMPDLSGLDNVFLLQNKKTFLRWIEKADDIITDYEGDHITVMMIRVYPFPEKIWIIYVSPISDK